MIHHVFTVHDVKAQAYLPPFILPKREMAIRTFSDCVNSDSHQFAAHPEDYTLFELGFFDDETALYNLRNAPQSLGNGVDFVQYTDVSEAMEGSTDAETQSGQTQKRNGSSIQPGADGTDSPE